MEGGSGPDAENAIKKEGAMTAAINRFSRAETPPSPDPSHQPGGEEDEG